MLLLTAVIAALQVTVDVRTTRDTSAADSARRARIERDSVRRSAWRAKRRIPLTPALLASAYRDVLARDIITRARSARLAQDTSLISYDAVAKQRLSAGLGVRAIGRERLLFRTENASRVRWRQGVGAYVDVIGMRTAIPLAFPGARVLEDLAELSAIPYFPGREGLLVLTGMERVTDTDEGLFIHPLTEGSEAYYRYSSGDSIVFNLPDGQRIRLREVEVAARQPRFDLIVGSLWFDVSTGQLVRAAYRPSQHFDIMKVAREQDPEEMSEIPLVVRPLITPMELQIAGFTVEYGLHEGRWWLPRSQTVDGRFRMGFTRVPFKAAETFRYSSVNGLDTLPPIALSTRDSLALALSGSVNIGIGGGGGGESDNDRRRGERRALRDSLRAMSPKQRDSVRKARGLDDNALRGLRCTEGDTLVRSRLRYDRSLPVVVRIPCDTAALAHSPELPPSIFDAGEEVFGGRERDELLKELSFDLQPGWSPSPPEFHYGAERGLLRYNRIEALSAGVAVEQSLGRGYVGEATARIGFGDWEPNGELRLSRSDGRRTFGIAGYRRLAHAGDWGDPLSLGSSLGAVLFARDEGLYFRTLGAELSGTHERGGVFRWRGFVERQSNAKVETQFSLPNAINGTRFIDNILADKAVAYGLGSTWNATYGLDPHGWRAITDVRTEAAGGDFDYVRGALDLTLSHGLGKRMDGAITASAGTSGGILPVQRLWYLGGTQTIRGQPTATAAGSAYWLGRAELGTALVAARPVVFYDLGWAGDRRDFGRPGRPLSGAGFGLSFLEGLLRFDVAKGIRPSRGWRGDVYVEARF